MSQILIIGTLFVVLLIILAANPKLVSNIYYSSLLGRFLLVSIVVFFTMCNTTLGLLVALVIIMGLNQFRFFLEGMDNNNSSSQLSMSTNTITNPPTTIGDENIKATGGQTVLTKSAVQDVKKRISDLKKEANGTNVVDTIVNERNITKDSKQIPIDTNMNTHSSEEVNPSSENMLKPNTTLEGFSYSLF
jgi:hypothetical protein